MHRAVTSDFDGDTKFGGRTDSTRSGCIEANRNSAYSCTERRHFAFNSNVPTLIVTLSTSSARIASSGRCGADSTAECGQSTSSMSCHATQGGSSRGTGDHMVTFSGFRTMISGTDSGTSRK